jgi:hypothetical protein
MRYMSRNILANILHKVQTDKSYARTKGKPLGHKPPPPPPPQLMGFQDKWVPQCGKCTCSSCSGAQFFFMQLSLPLYIKVTADSIRTVHQRSPRSAAHKRFQVRIFLACIFVFLVMGPFEGWSKNHLIGFFIGLMVLLAFVAFLINRVCRCIQIYLDDKCMQHKCRCHLCLTSSDT